jgi:lysophospholipase L1-like esterase
VWKTAVHALLGPLSYAWVVSRARQDGALAFPSDPPISHGSGPDPDRILILGGLNVRGMGVASYDLALSGHLARQLASATGRGADIETRGIPRFDARIAAEVLRDENLPRFDAVLLMLGMADVISMRPMPMYQADLRALLDIVRTVKTPAQTVLIAGVPQFMRGMDVPAFVADRMERRIIRQNAATKRLCEESGVAEYVEFSPERAGIDTGRDAAAVYESWANALAPALELVLDEVAGALEPSPAVDESARQDALDALRVDEAHDATVDRIVEMARDMLGTDVASLNFIDHDRQWTKSAAGFDAADVPREEALCNTTIQTRGAYVVEDLSHDASLRDSSWARGEQHVRFYAGYPLEAPGGERVGALCVMDREPRHFTASETATLRDLALAAQAILWEQAS